LEFRKRLPNKGDVNRAALSLLRLQITYRLNSSELAEGILVSRKDIIVNKYPMNGENKIVNTKFVLRLSANISYIFILNSWGMF